MPPCSVALLEPSRQTPPESLRLGAAPHAQEMDKAPQCAVPAPLFLVWPPLTRARHHKRPYHSNIRPALDCFRCHQRLRAENFPISRCQHDLLPPGVSTSSSVSSQSAACELREDLACEAD